MRSGPRYATPAGDGAPLNGDGPLTPAERRAYFRNGWREIREDVEWRGTVQATGIVASSDARSPFRVYSDTVLQQTLAELEPPPRDVVDIGCGSGSYARGFKDGEGTYHGVDVVAQAAWRAIEDEARGWRRAVTFHHMPAEALDTLPVRADFSFSCSALEHVDDPDAVARGIGGCTAPGGYGLHVTPAPWSLLLYGPHGWRRFSSSRLRAMFADAGFDVVRIQRLGGVPSLLLHFIWITGIESGRALDFATGSHLPSIVSRVLAHVRYQGARTGRVAGAVYTRLLRLAVRLDPFLPRMPVGYAVLVRRREIGPA